MIIIIIHEFHGDTSLKQNLRATEVTTLWQDRNMCVITRVDVVDVCKLIYFVCRVPDIRPGGLECTATSCYHHSLRPRWRRCWIQRWVTV